MSSEQAPPESAAEAQVRELRVLVAFAAGEVGWGEAAQALGLDALTFRDRYYDELGFGVSLVRQWRLAHPPAAQTILERARMVPADQRAAIDPQASSSVVSRDG